MNNYEILVDKSLQGVKDGQALTRLINRFLCCRGEEYVLRYRYNKEGITAGFRLYLKEQGFVTYWTDKKLYGLIEARLSYVLELKPKFDNARARIGVSNSDVASMFGYCNYTSFLLSSRRNKNIQAFLRIVEALAP